MSNGFQFLSLPDNWCSSLLTSNSNISTSVYYQVAQITTCVVTSLLAPMTVAGNAFILAAIWKNPSLSTPSRLHVLLAGLAFNDFCTGFLPQPFYVVYRLGDFLRSIKMFCIGGVIIQISGYYFSSLTVVVMAITAVQR